MIGKANAQKYLCPVGLRSLELQGRYETDIFKYFKISVKGCQLDDPEINCKHDAEIENLHLNIFLLKA